MWATSFPRVIRGWEEVERASDGWIVVDRAGTIVAGPVHARPFTQGRSKNAGGDTQGGPRAYALIESAGGYDAWTLGFRGTAPIIESGGAVDAWSATKGPTAIINESAAGADTWARTQPRSRPFTETGVGTDGWSSRVHLPRPWIELGRGNDRQWFLLSGPRNVIRQGQVLSQVWGKGAAADTYGDALDISPLRSDGSLPPLTNDTIGADRGVGSTSTGNLMAGTDIGGLIDFGDGEVGIVGGDLFGPTVPAGYSNSHPSVGTGPTWTFYRPSALAISRTQLANLAGGIAINRFHRRIALKNPGQGLIEVDGAAPLQSDITYVGSVPNRIATFPNHYYAFNSGVTIPDVGGDVYAYSCALITEGQGGLLVSTDKINWTHEPLWTNASAPYWGKGAALEIADANGNPPPSVAAVRADIAANVGTYYLYALGSQLPTAQKGLYLGRCRLLQQAGHAATRVVALSASAGFPPTFWEYWNGTGWAQQGTANPTPVQLIGDTYFNSLTNGGYSLRYDTYLGRWLLLYCGLKKTLQGGTQICYRTAPQIQGPWSDERTIDGLDLAATVGTNVTLNLTPYSAQIHPYATGGPDFYFLFSVGFPFNNPDPTQHAYIDDGTGHCQRWRTHLTGASTTGNVGCTLTLAQHNAMQAAYAAHSEAPGFGFSVPYAVYLGRATIGRPLTSVEILAEAGAGIDVWTQPPRPFTRTISEASVGNDTWQSFLGRNVRVDAEPGTATDGWTTQLHTTATIVETGNGTDAWTATHPTAPWNEPSSTVDTWSTAIGGLSRFWIETQPATDDWVVTVRTLNAPATWAAGTPHGQWDATVMTEARWSIGTPADRWSANLSSPRWRVEQMARWAANVRDAGSR